MITINLLPKELQEDIRKPKSQIFAAIGAVLLILISSGIFVAIHMALETRINALNVANQERDDARQYEERCTAVVALKEQFKSYSDAVEKCKAQQVSLSKRVSLLASIVTGPNLYWLDNLQITPVAAATDRYGRPGTDAAMYKWEAAAFCKETILAKVYALTTMLRDHPEFGREVEKITLPVPVESPISGDYEEKRCFRFNLKMVTKVSPKKDQEQPKPPAQPQAG